MSTSSADDRTVILDPDRTLLIPRPGGRATSAKSPRGGAPAQGATLQYLVAGINPLLTAAGPLLALISQLRATTHHADRAGLQRQLLGLIGEFEERARASGVSRPQITAARYLLCTFIDEVIAATPWGAEAPPGTRGLLQEFHEDQSGATKVFELLDRLSADSQAQAPLLELFYVCFALGFEGHYAGKPNGRAELAALSARLFERVRPGTGRRAAGDARTLSTHWAGETRRGPTLTLVPLWLTVVVGAALVLGALMWMSTRLSRQAAPLLQQMHDMHRALAVAPPAAPAKARVAPLLADDLSSGTLDVAEDAQRSVITLGADALFVDGTAQVQPAQRARLARVAKALAALPGRIEVLGHTDDTAVESLRFPSNWHLSRERAQAVAGALSAAGVPAARLRAEGRAETEPRVPNDSPSARARNRRIEVLLLLPRPES
jgi:type VI secretion system protein ImpK